jgi:hypothetical protein
MFQLCTLKQQAYIVSHQVGLKRAGDFRVYVRGVTGRVLLFGKGVKLGEISMGRSPSTHQHRSRSADISGKGLSGQRMMPNRLYGLY